MADNAPEVAPSAEEAAASRAKILEGVDFIETEEDAEAVESAVVKIQSTFRGKKIRSKLTQKPAQASTTSTAATAAATKQGADSNQADEKESAASSESKAGAKATGTSCSGGARRASGARQAEQQDEELNKKVAKMQVNDNGGARQQTDGKEPAAGSNASAGCKLPEEEAERAATKIQAGFKGYKTRKELESKLGGQQAPGQEANASKAAE